MEEILKALAPWPLLEGLVLGMIVAAAGFWAMRRGMLESQRHEHSANEPQNVRLHLTDEERRLQWEFYKQMEHLHENSFAMVKHMEKMVEQQLMTIAAVNRVADGRWNKHQ